MAQESVEDMIHLPELSEDSLMQNLNLRYQQKLIYTYTGSILVALNPFQRLQIYGVDLISKYQGKLLSENSPHIFAIAEIAFSNVRNFQQNQSIIISGESGSGKTESTKVILQYLTAVTSQAGDGQQSWVEQQILEANTVLESFGNAKTVRNNNSSRFGKFVQVLFDRKQSIIGANIINYLLEKSRVVKQANTERNYHVFYEMLSGAGTEEKKMYQLLKDASAYRYLNHSGCVAINGVNDGKNFEALKLALSVLKMNMQDVDSTFKVVSSILHLGNVEFVKDDKTEVSALNAQSQGSITIICSLLGIDVSKLSTCLLNRKITVRNESTLVPLKLEQAVDNRDSIAKTLYDKLFIYLIEHINNSTASNKQPDNFIGVLDIFGFELFEVNSFEQLCINYTNEKLQQFFNQFIFKLEMQEYVREGIDVASIDYKDNQACIDLIEGKLGVLSLLDEECKMPKGAEETYLQKMHDQLVKNEHYVKPRTAKGCFGIKHYAGEVTYQIAGFLDKNRDAVPEEIVELFQSSSLQLVQKLFKKEVTPAQSQQSKGKATAGSNFKNQLISLVNTLGATTPHYVRCIKPNWEKKAFVFDPELTLAQLRYAGMMETIKIRKIGFPLRFQYELVVNKFRFLIPDSAHGNVRDACLKLMNALKIEPKNYKLGQTKLFLKQQALDKLIVENEQRKSRMIILLQKTYKGKLYRQRFLAQRNAALKLQYIIRSHLIRKRYITMRAACIQIQSAVRGWFARDYLRQLKAEKKAQELALAQQKEAALKLSLQPQQLVKSASIGEVNGQPDVPLVDVSSLPPPLPPPMSMAPPQAVVVKPPTEDEIQLQSLVDQRKKRQTVMLENQKRQSAVPAKKGELDMLFSFLDDINGDGSDQIRNSAVNEEEAIIIEEMEDIFKLNEDDINAAVQRARSNNALDADSAGNESKQQAQVADQDQSAAIEQQVTDQTAKLSIQESTNVVVTDENQKPALPVQQNVQPPEPPAKLRFNPLAAKLKEQEGNVVEEDKSLRAFAEKFFNQHSQTGGNSTIAATFSKKKAAGKILDISAMLSYTKHPLPSSIINIKKPVIVNFAIDCFKHLNKYLDFGLKKGEESIAIVRKMIEFGLGNPELRDELYIQVIRQITPSPDSQSMKNWNDWIMNGWHLLMLYSQTFPPSKVFSKYLLHYYTLNSAPDKKAEYKSVIQKCAVYCEQTVRKIVTNGARKHTVTAEEITSTIDMSPVLCRISLMDGQIKGFPMTLTMTAAEVVKELGFRLSIQDMSGWCLVEVQDEPFEERVLRSTDYIADIYASWEERAAKSLIESKSSSISLTSTVSRKSGRSVSSPLAMMSFTANNSNPKLSKQGSNNQLSPKKGGSVLDYKICLKKRLFKDPNEVPRNPIEFSLIYAQHANDVIREKYPLTDKFACQLAALKMFIDWGDYDPNTYGSAFDLQKYVPLSIAERYSEDEWIQQISDYHQKLKGKSNLQAKLMFIDALHHFQYFGATLFAVKFKGFWQHPENVVLAVSAHGLFFMLKSKTIIDFFNYEKVIGWEVDAEMITISIQRNMVNGQNDLLTENYKFASKAPEEVALLLKEYSMKSGAKKDRDLFVSEAEMSLLAKDLDKSRFTLLKKQLISFQQRSASNVAQIFEQQQQQSNQSPESFVQLPPQVEQQQQQQQQQALTDAQINQIVNEWPIRILTVQAPLLVSPARDQSLNSAAQRLSLLLQEAANSFVQTNLTSSAGSGRSLNIKTAGLNESLGSSGTLRGGGAGGQRASVSQHPEWVQIGRIVHRGFEEPRLIDELYMQLIKYTTEYSDPNSKSALFFWRTLAVTCGCLRPKSADVIDLLRSHLRRYSVIEQKTPGDLMRRDEVAFAKYCSKTMAKNMQTDPRLCPPSQDEIVAVCKLASVSARIYLPDGQYRALGFTPHSLCREILALFLQKLKLQDSYGFALYIRTIATGQMKHILEQTKLSDVLGNWDKDMKKASLKDCPYQLVIRRRLYASPQISSPNEIEEELMMHFATSDVLNLRYPASVDDLAMLAAFKCQAENGDEHPSKQLDYNSVMQKYVPVQMRSNELLVMIKREHSSLRKRTPAECKKLYMNKIRTAWKYYGASIFSVQQNYSSEIPRQCWLLVDGDGVHVSPEMSKQAAVSMTYAQIGSTAVDAESLMLVSISRDVKLILQTSDADEIQDIMKEYQQLRVY
ncbi:hypothetical protein MP228_008576 [Amoeboaphelidium protococcarum]|nr:hypothetical protein MP228_008576 [Amoeboaphelidium protococcarum]